MSASAGELLPMLAAGGARADWLASVLAELIVCGGRLGELEDDAAIGVDGDWRAIKRPPAIWLDRLVLAARRGAFERMTVSAAVERILTPPAES